MHRSYIRCILFLLPVLSSASSTRAGIRMRTSEAGLNTLLEFSTDHLLRPYLEKSIKVLTIPFSGSTYILNDIRIRDLVEPRAVVDIQEGNYIGLKVTVKRFSIASNVSIDNGENVDIYPDTVVIFGDMSLEVSLRLKKEGKLTRIDLEKCISNIGKFDSEGELRDVLLGLYELASGEIEKMTETVCSSLQNQTQTLLNSFFDVTTSLKITSHGRKINLYYSLESITSDNDAIQIVFMTALKQEDVTDASAADFPAPSTLSNSVRGRDMEMWFNGELLTTILSRLMVLDIFKDSSYTTSDKRYSGAIVYVNRATEVRLTSSGAVVISSAKFDIETDACAQLSVNLTAELPVKFEFGFTSLKFGFDEDRLNLTYRVTNSRKKENCPDESKVKVDVTKEDQKNIISACNGHLETLFRDNFIVTDLKFDYFENLNFKDTSISTVENALAVVTSIHIGQPVTKPMVTKTNPDYKKKLVSLTYDDGTVESLQKGSNEIGGVTQMSAAASLIGIMSFVAVCLF